MLQDAIKKLRDEMQGSDKYMVIVGEHVTNHITTYPATAEKVLDAGKTIKGAVTEMSNVARQNSNGAMAWISDEDGFKVVRKYFGIEVDTPSVNIDINLDDLLK